MKRITIVAIDDHKLIREMWRLLFLDSQTNELIGDSGTFDGGMEMVKLMRPDIVLLDINLQDASGLNAVPMIRKYSPGTRIIAVSMHTEPAYAKKMLHLGVRAYITKNASHKEVFEAIDIVMHDGIYICSEIKNLMVKQMLDTGEGVPDIKKLSLREIEVVIFIKKGLSSKEIASKINVSDRTVEVHRHNILTKLNLKNTVALIDYIHTTDLGFI